MKLQCKTHSDEEYLYFKLPQLTEIQLNQQQYLQCARCITEGSTLNCRSLILLSDILSKTENDYFYNWPILEGELIKLEPHPYRDILKKVFSNKIHQEAVENQQKIRVFIKNLKENIVKKIDQIEILLLQNERQIIQDNESVKVKYKEINNIYEIKNILERISAQDINAIEYTKTINDFIQKQNDKETTAKIFTEVETLLKKFQFDLDKNLEFIDHSVTMQLNKIEINLKDDIEKYQDKTNPQSDSDKNINELMKLISNKTNFCSDQFLIDIQKHFKQNQMIFSDNDIIKSSDAYQYNVVDYSHLNEQQLLKLKNLINIQSNYFQNIPKDDVENQATNTSNFLSKLKNIFSPKTFQLLKEIFYQYPVLDVFDKFSFEDRLDFNKIFQLDLQEINKLISQFNDAKSSQNIIKQLNFSQATKYSGMKISYEDNQIQFNQNSRALQKCWSNQIINKDFVYQLKFRIKQMQRQGNGHVLVGIIPDELKEKQLHDQDLQKTFVWNNDNGCKDSIKGVNFYEIKGPNTNFTIYFSIKNKFFFVCDNLCTSINYKKDAKFFENKSYRICISINNGFRDQTLEIIEFNQLNL